MKNKKQYITNCEKKIKENEVSLNEEYLRITDIVFTFSKEKINGSVIAKNIDHIKDINKEILNEQKRIDKILLTLEKADEIDSLIRNHNDEIKLIEKDRVSNYETIGRAAYEAYKDGDFNDDKYHIIFSDIIKLNEKIDKTEAELKKLSAMAGGSRVFVRLKSATKIVYLKNSCKNYFSNLNKSYKRAGKRICQTELLTALDTDSIENAIRPYKENLKGLKKLEQEELLLFDKNTKIKGDLEKLGVHKSPNKTIEAIQNHINELYQLKKLKQIDTGKLLVERKDDKLCKEQDVLSVITEIEGYKNTIFKLKEEINNTIAEIDISKKIKEIKELNKKIIDNNDKIKKINKKNDEFKKIKNEIEEKIEIIKKSKT